MEHIKETAGFLESRPAILVIGSNVLMEAVANCLEDKMVSQLIRWDCINFDLKATLQVLLPGLIIFEVDTPGQYMLLDLLREHPGIHLLGINQDSNQVIVLSSVQRNILTLTDLYNIVKEIAGDWD